MIYSFASDVKLIKPKLLNLPTFWEGKKCVLELKEANYNWKQMEWWAFYFEYKVKQLLKDSHISPGDKFDTVKFDLKTEINWDIKASAIKSQNHKIILNDTSAMEQSIQNYGYHGEIIGLCDVEYNDEDRSFQKWHTGLKGGLSNYEIKRGKRPNSFSRYRKTSAELMEIVYVVFRKEDLEKLDIMVQGRNSNDRPRPTKYMLNLERIDDYEHEKQQFAEL